MEKTNLNDQHQETYPNPPSYDQATGNSLNGHPKPESRSVPYPSPPPGFVPADNYPNVPPVQQTIYQSNYPQQQGQYPQTQPQVVVIQNTPIPLGPGPSYVTCPFCHIQKLTRVDTNPSPKTHLMAALLCILGFWCCVCLPYCIDGCMSVNHYCGNCNRFLGTCV